MKVKILLILFLFLSVYSFTQNTFLRQDQFPLAGKFCCAGYAFEDGEKYKVLNTYSSVPSIYNDFVLIEYDKQGNYINHRFLEKEAYRFSNRGSFIQSNELIWCNGDAETDSGFHTITLAYNFDGDLIHSLGFEGSFQDLFYLNDSLVGGYFCERKWTNGEIEKTYYMAIYDGNEVVNLNIEEFHFPVFIDGSIYLIDNSNDNSTIFKRLNSDKIIDSVFYYEKLDFESIHYLNLGILLYGRNINNQGISINFINKELSIIWRLTVLDSSNLNLISIVDNIRFFPVTVRTGKIIGLNKSYTVLNKLTIDGILEPFFDYDTDQVEVFRFSPFVQTSDGGYLGTAYHWNSPYQFNIMKTDSLGRVFESDYLGGITFTGISENDVPFTPNQIELYPNPNNGQFRMGNEELGVVEVYNLQGQKVNSQRITQVNELINLNQPLSGVYLLRFIQENGTVKNAKFVVE